MFVHTTYIYIISYIVAAVHAICSNILYNVQSVEYIMYNTNICNMQYAIYNIYYVVCNICNNETKAYYMWFK